MSLINDALSKVERDRAAQRLAAYPGAPSNRTANRRPANKARTSRLLLLNVAVLSALCAVALFFFLPRAPRDDARTPALDVASATPVDTAIPATPEPVPSTAPTTAVATHSPFSAPAADAAASAPPPASEYELAGMTAVGDNTLISVMRRSDQRSVWIPIGKSVGEISAVSYNALSDQAVIRVRGQLLTVGMRSGPIEPSAPADEQPAE